MSALLNKQFEKSLKSRKQFEIKFMSDIESSLNGALDNLNAEKVSFRLSANKSELSQNTLSGKTKYTGEANYIKDKVRISD